MCSSVKNLTKIIFLIIGFSSMNSLFGMKSKNFSTRFFYDFFKEEHKSIAKGSNVEGMLKKLTLNKVYKVDMSNDASKKKTKVEMPKNAKMAYVKKVKDDLIVVQIPIPKQTRGHECVFNAQYYSSDSLFGGTDFIEALKKISTREKAIVYLSGKNHGMGTKNRALIWSCIASQGEQEGMSPESARKKAERVGWSKMDVFGGKQEDRLINTLKSKEKNKTNPFKYLKATRCPQLIVFTLRIPVLHCLFGRLELVGEKYKVFFVFDSIPGNSNALDQDHRIKKIKFLVNVFTSLLKKS